MAVSTTNSKISPCLWFDDQAEEAANFYVNLFNTSPQAEAYPASSVGFKTHYMEEAIQHCQNFKPGKALNVLFSLAGQEMMALNGGPMFKFTSAISLMVECKDQADINHFWDGFTQGLAERELNCGWCLDRYGLSWQIVPRYIREVRYPLQEYRSPSLELKLTLLVMIAC